MPLSEMKWVILFRGGTYSDRKMLTLLSRKESGQTREKKFRSKWTSLESLIQIARPGVDATRPDTHDRTKLTCWVPDTELLFSQGVAGIRRRHPLPSERSHPGSGFLNERPRSNDAHSLA